MFALLVFEPMTSTEKNHAPKVSVPLLYWFGYKPLAEGATFIQWSI